MTRLETDRGPAANAGDRDFNRRWAAWLLRGRARDARSQRLMLFVRGLVLAGGAAWALWTAFVR